MELKSNTLHVRKKNHSQLLVLSEPHISNELNDFFSFEVPGHKYMPAFKQRRWDGKVRLFSSAKSELPCGLYEYLDEFVKPRNYTIEVEHDTTYGRPDSNVAVDPKDLAQFIKSLNLPFEPRDYQFDAISQAIHSKRLILLSPTGSGKSLIIYVLMALTTGRITSLRHWSRGIFLTGSRLVPVPLRVMLSWTLVRLR